MKKIFELLKKYREPIMYIIVGGLTTVVSFATQFFAHLIGADTKAIFADGITLASIQALMNEGLFKRIHFILCRKNFYIRR